MAQSIPAGRLYQVLNNTGLQNKDNPLYQLLYSLIGQVLNLQNTSSGSSSSSGGGNTVIINNGIPMMGLDGESGEDGMPGPPGTNGTNGATPALNEVTVTTTGNIDDLNIGTAEITIIRMNNATLSTIRGMIPTTAGQIVCIVSIGAGQVNLSHQDTGESTAARRLINFVTSGITPLAAGVGAAIYQYDGTTARWRLVSHEQGACIAIPYTSGDFTGNNSMTWTVDSGDLLTYQYYLKGRRLSIDLTVSNSSIGGTPSSLLQALIPNGWTFTAGQNILQPARVATAGTSQFGVFNIQPAVSTTKILIGSNVTFSTWAASTNNANAQGQIEGNID